MGETIDLAMLLLLLLFVLGHHRAGACGAPVVAVLQGAVSRTLFAHSQPCSMRTLCITMGMRSAVDRCACMRYSLLRACLQLYMMFHKCQCLARANTDLLALHATFLVGVLVLCPVFLKLLLDPVPTILGALITSAWFHTFRPT